MNDCPTCPGWVVTWRDRATGRSGRSVVADGRAAGRLALALVAVIGRGRVTLRHPGGDYEVWEYGPRRVRRTKVVPATPGLFDGEVAT